MKKKIIIIILIVLTLIPVKIDIKDGGSVSYEALLYGVTIYNESILGPLRGTEVRILWFYVYDGSYYIYEPSVDFADVDLTGVSEIELRNVKNGETSIITDDNDIAHICTYIGGLKGQCGSTTKGRNNLEPYESYEIKFNDINGNEVLALTFMEEWSEFLYGDDGEGYPIYYSLNTKIDEVLDFLSKYDTSYSDKLYDKYKYPNKDFFGDELYSEIEHKASESELEIGNQIVEKGNKVFDFYGTLKESEELGNVGELNRYFYFAYEGAESQNADLSFITCIISGDKGKVWVVYSVERFDSQGKIINASKNVLSLWYIEKYENDWNVVEIKEAP